MPAAARCFPRTHADTPLEMGSSRVGGHSEHTVRAHLASPSLRGDPCCREQRPEAAGRAGTGLEEAQEGSDGPGLSRGLREAVSPCSLQRDAAWRRRGQRPTLRCSATRRAEMCGQSPSGTPSSPASAAAPLPGVIPALLPSPYGGTQPGARFPSKAAV